MIRTIIEAESVEELTAQIAELAKKLSATEKDHGTQTGTNSIAQPVQEVQEDYSQMHLVPLTMEVGLEQRGLSITNTKSGSANIIGCPKTVDKIIDYVGVEDFFYGVDVLIDAYPDGGEQRWNAMLLKDVCIFVHFYRHRDDFLRRYLVNHLRKHVTSSRTYSPTDIVQMVTDRPGEACLKRYNSGISKTLPDILPRKGAAV